MKTIFKHLLLIGWLVPLLATAEVDPGKKELQFDYEASCAGIGTQGTYLVKISTYGKKVKEAKTKSKKSAVHAVLFKGISGNASCQGQKPICNVSYEEKKEWFDKFFESGEYLQYVSFSNDGYVDASDMVKVSRRRYKVGVTVVIQKDALRKLMEKQGFAKSLGQGF